MHISYLCVNPSLNGNFLSVCAVQLAKGCTIYVTIFYRIIIFIVFSDLNISFPSMIPIGRAVYLLREKKNNNLYDYYITLYNRIVK